MAMRVNCAHILVPTEARAKELLLELKGGADFASLARRYSTCPSRKDGGSLGWFGKGEMVKPFEDAAFKARKGDLVGPVKTDFGYHIILVKDVKE